MNKAKEVKGEKDLSNVQQEEDIHIEKTEDSKDKKTENKTTSQEKTKEESTSNKTEKKEEKENGEFSAIEILVPTTELVKDKELIKKIQPPKWESYTYVNENGKCVSKHHDNEDDAKNYYKTELMNDPKANRIVLA